MISMDLAEFVIIINIIIIIIHKMYGNGRDVFMNKYIEIERITE